MQQHYTFETLANGELATVPHGVYATVLTTYPDGIFPHYTVIDPSAPAGSDPLYCGESHKQATAVASEYNIALACID